MRRVADAFWRRGFSIVFASLLALSASGASDLRRDPLLWVYVGRTDNTGHFSSTHFEITNIPEKGQKLTPTATMSLRASGPEKEAGIWMKSKRISYLWQDMSLLVERTKIQWADTGFRYHWAGGKVLLEGEVNQAVKPDWFVVVGSEVTMSQAIARAEGIKRENPSLPVEIYLSENQYMAIVIGAGLSQAEAKNLVLDAIDEGIAEDAYMWRSKQWELLRKL